MLLSELEELNDITNELVFEDELIDNESDDDECDEPSIFTEEYANELIETALHVMDDFMELYPHSISDPHFHTILLEEIKDLFYIQMEDFIESLHNGEDIEDDMNDILEYAFTVFITTFHAERSTVSLDTNANVISNMNINLSDDNDAEIDIIEEKIQGLRDLPQPVQRTPEWYQFRWNLITASNAYKAFESQATINQLIYEKCQPLKTNNSDANEIKMVNTNTPMHWGQKYEPLTVLIYERDYNAKVEDFGCIKHPTYAFLGASPDGIVVNKGTERYGRMLEIKNVVSRDITGIPKKEYWVQTQLQMEVCDLDECDFLETKFIEYPDVNSYDEDVTDISSPCISKDNKTKGIIIYFHTKEGAPFYVYKPLDLITLQQISDWEESTISLYQSDKYNYIYMKFIYWKLEKLSCVLVVRNREWFKNNILQLEKVWKIIEEERITGYEHRAPVKKQKKECIKPLADTQSQGCLLTFTKIIKLE